MVKHFNVIMAGVISGIVALFTSFLGISGTVIGSVISSFLYQFFSSYSAEKYEERLEERGSKPKNIGSEIVYAFPIVVIALIEVIYIFSALHYRFDMLFNLLEAAVSNNLFRFMGLGLIALGIYPLVMETDIDKINGKIVLVAGIFLFLRGMVDITPITAQLYNMVFYRFDFIFAILVVIALAFVIFNVLRTSASEYLHKESDDAYVKSNGNSTYHRFSRPQKKSGARKIDTSFHKRNDFNEIYSNNNHSNSNERVSRPSVQDAVQEDLPIYEEKIIYVKNPDNPDVPIKKRILKRVDSDSKNDDGYDDTYIIGDGDY